MNHKPRKRFGQNFLQNQTIINAILQVINLQAEDKVIEIGPGLGALTLPMLRHLNHLIAIEIDTDLQTYLAELGAAKLKIIGMDALTVDFSQWGEQQRLVGNLPYNISTPLLLYLMKYISCIKDMHFMLQKEVAERIVAQPGCKAYGRLSIMLQYHCEVDYLLDVPPEAFVPQPKVDSAILRLLPHKKFPYPVVDMAQFERIVAQAFSMRRKTIANNLKPLLNAEQLKNLNINPACRPEQITVSDYVSLANFFSK